MRLYNRTMLIFRFRSVNVFVVCVCNICYIFHLSLIKLTQLSNYVVLNQRVGRTVTLFTDPLVGIPTVLSEYTGAFTPPILFLTLYNCLSGIIP